MFDHVDLAIYFWLPYKNHPECKYGYNSVLYVQHLIPSLSFWMYACVSGTISGNMANYQLRNIIYI